MLAIAIYSYVANYANMLVCPCASHTMTVRIPAIPTSTVVTNLIVLHAAPFQKSRSTPDS